METREDIVKELEELSPRLAARAKANPFTVPDGYFNQQGMDIMASVKADSVHSELAEAPQLLAKRGEENKFTVPYGYFENFEAKLMQKIATEETTPVRKLKTYLQYSVGSRQVMAVLAIAAMLVIVLLLFKPQQSIQPTTPQVAEVAHQAVPQTALSAQDIQEYLNGDVSALDEQTIADQLTLNKGKHLMGQEETKLDVKDPSLIDISQVDLSTIENL